MSRRREVKTIYADEVREYMRKHRESDYQLIDVREPREYTDGHVPGAKLISLGELPDRIPELTHGVDLLFYCRSGKRSRMAASIVADSNINARSIYTMEGGILAWDGRPIEDFPQVKLFSRIKDMTEILKLAMDLEKGAWIFYSSILKKYPESKMSPAAKALVKLERTHAKTIFNILKKRSTDKPVTQDFDDYFDQLKGDIIEGGETVEQAIEKVRDFDPDDCLSFGELALDIEYKAYDMYKNLYYDTENEDEKKIFQDLSEQEKGHALVVARLIGKCME